MARLGSGLDAQRVGVRALLGRWSRGGRAGAGVSGAEEGALEAGSWSRRGRAGGGELEPKGALLWDSGTNGEAGANKGALETRGLGPRGQGSAEATRAQEPVRASGAGGQGLKVKRAWDLRNLGQISPLRQMTPTCGCPKEEPSLKQSGRGFFQPFHPRYSSRIMGKTQIIELTGAGVTQLEAWKEHPQWSLVQARLQRNSHFNRVHSHLGSKTASRQNPSPKATLCLFGRLSMVPCFPDNKTYP
ncbi:uncharacterized protein [Petaurus breviceps papuanus]|uniref:uncharacterized protein n=1 Tax=Petaurus breviceps papuanus TaxID=3040969 RepID=UPI0036D7FDE1